MEINVGAKTKLFCLIGSPVGHSGSPDIYNFAFKKHGIDSVYMAFDVTEEKVPDAINAMRTFGVRGANVTMPDKRASALCMDKLSPAAQIIGAVNTIVNNDGVFEGHITDGIGFVDNLRDHGVETKGANVVLVGAGGAGTAIYVQAVIEGAKSVRVYNSSSANLERAKDTIKKVIEMYPGADIKAVPLEDRESFLSDIKNADILINATPVGMHPNADKSIIADDELIAFHEGLAVADCVYNPVETKLLKQAKDKGLKAVDGTGMLLWQAVAAYKLYTGLDFPVEEYKAMKAKM
ncbi:MAG: shikimate dehydrogenase [Lachnospiraceae bacterium]|nr:shikimate dehydrogenase [Lachnospiraceae bacterium]